MVASLKCGRELIPAQAVVNGQPSGYFPGIADVQAVGALLGAILVDIVDVQVATIDSANQEAGKRVAALDARLRRAEGRKTHGTGLIVINSEYFLQMAKFSAELYGVRTMN
jgi:hypothetical protein